MEEKKVTLTFFLDNPVEEHPDVHLVQNWQRLQPSGMGDKASRSPALPVGDRRRHRRKRWGDRRREEGFSLPEKRRENGRKGSKLILVASSAIAVGLIMGMTVLSLFSQGDEASLPTAREPLSRETGEEELLMTPGTDPEKGELVLPSLTFFVAQAGAFSGEEAALKAREQLQGKGYPAKIFRGEDSFNLYVALGATKADMEALGERLERSGLDIYLKKVETKPLTFGQKGDLEKIEPLPDFLSASGQLMEQLLESSAMFLKGEGLKEQELRSLKELHRQVLLEGQKVINVLDGQVGQHGEDMMRELTVALSALEAYVHKPHSAYVWQIQQAGLNYLALYEAMLDKLEKLSEG